MGKIKEHIKEYLLLYALLFAFIIWTVAWYSITTNCEHITGAMAGNLTSSTDYYDCGWIRFTN